MGPLHGTLPEMMRQKVLRQLADGQCNIMISSQGVGGFGLNLGEVSMMILIDMSCIDHVGPMRHSVKAILYNGSEDISCFKKLRDFLDKNGQ